MTITRPLAIAFTFVIALLAAEIHAAPAVIDACETTGGWTVAPADGVEASLETVATDDGAALRLHYHFVAGGGFVVLRRALDLDLGENYRFTFNVRGTGPPNNLEFKLIDTAGDSVWWVNRRRFVLPSPWTVLSQKARHFEFAWGPSGGAPLTGLSAIEFAVASAEGGKGYVDIDEITFEHLPKARPITYPIAVKLSSASPDTEPRTALADNGLLRWRADRSDETPTVELHFGHVSEFGGLLLGWGEVDYASSYEVFAVDDAGAETPLTQVTDSRGGLDAIYLPQTETPRVRIRFRRSADSQPIYLDWLRILPVECGDNPNRFFAAVAEHLPRGRLPRYFSNEQQPWTVAGVVDADREALIGAGGAVEWDRLMPRIEPFIRVNNQLRTWSDGEFTSTLAERWQPIPTVTQRLDKLELRTTALAFGGGPDAPLALRYTLTNTADQSRQCTLFLAVRPFQVLPPWQSLNITGGFTPLHHLAWEDDVLAVNDAYHVRPLTAPTAFGAMRYAGSDIVESIARGHLPAAHAVDDPAGRVSGAFQFDFELDAGAQRDVVVLLTPSGSADQATVSDAADAGHWFAEQLAATTKAWRERVQRVGLDLPPAAQKFVDTFYAQQAYVLVNADGPAIQPGSRTYERSWIRDGALTSTALLQTGHADVVRRFIDWYAPNQFAGGKVPCVVDGRGPDPVPEHDSTGQLIYLLNTYHAYTGDRETLARHYPRIVAGIEYLDRLRRQRMTEEFGDGPPEKRMLYGLVPESISHEGYSAKPMHSYWDGFFVLRGLRDAARIATILGHADDARRFEKFLNEYRTAMYDSMRRSIELHGISYAPGCAELGDFDATSTAIGIAPCGELGHIPEPELHQTFERYFDFFTKRRDGVEPWRDYTPYELRLVGAFVRLGQRERAAELLDFFFQHQLPPGWMHWAEVVRNPLNTPAFIGDMPHTWCGSEFLRSFRTMFVYEDERDASLVLAAGLPSAWLEGEGARITNWPTEYGPLTYHIRRVGGELRCDVDLTGTLPPGGIRLLPPLTAATPTATIDGVAADVDAQGAILVRAAKFTALIRDQ